MYNYCTLFDSNYLTRGLAMYESLKTYSRDFHLYIFAFDARADALLKKLKLANVTVISLEAFEDDALLSIKSTRSAGEYCWTCTPSTIKYCIEQYDLDHCTYLDADLYFFADPSILVDEMQDASVLITEHRYTPMYDQSATSGIYCVQFVTFKNDARGIKALSWWRDACNAWCYARFEEGKFGDQKYLDDWTNRFEGVHVLQHLGGGVAPWNIQRYNISDESFDVIFYHFHGLKFLENNKIDLGPYRLRRKEIEKLYMPYVQHLEAIVNRLHKGNDTYDYHGTIKEIKDWKTPLRYFRRMAKRSYNIFNQKELLGK
ncbi:MAG: hypothetical protein PHR87_02750 [Sulfurospirillaceae bacterium]|nr:hypothetical protein [Sulfurospirillaceae bacterium]